MTPRYASETEVTVERSKNELERILRRYGATAFGHMWDQTAAVVVFEIHQRRVQMRLPLPDPQDHEFTMTPNTRVRRSPDAAAKAYEQAIRQRWRALVLIVKAKLEAVEAGISTVEREFLADIALPNGRTVGEWAGPQLAAAYDGGTMPALLPGGGTDG